MPSQGVSTTFCQLGAGDWPIAPGYLVKNRSSNETGGDTIPSLRLWVGSLTKAGCSSNYGYLRLHEMNQVRPLPRYDSMPTTTKRPDFPPGEGEGVSEPESPPDRLLVVAADEDAEFDDFDEEDFDDEFDDDFEEELDDEYELADLEEVTDDDLADDDDGLDEFGGDFVDEDEEAEPAAGPDAEEEAPEGGKKKKGKASPPQDEDD